MITADTSTWVAFLEGGPGYDTESLDRGLEGRQVVMVPVVLTELLSDPGLPQEVSEMLLQIPQMESCIDARVALLTRDRDFRAFVEAAQLDLILGNA